MSAEERVAALHKKALRLRAQADEAAQERDEAVHEELTEGRTTGPTLAAALDVSTARVYQMANRTRRRG